MMNYMPIMPIGMLDLLDETHTKDVFILPQFFKYDKYREFYTSRKWNNVIIDNALYENDASIPFDQMIEFADDINSSRTFIVGSENLDSGVMTAAMTISDVDLYGDRGNNWEMMTILHKHPNEMKEQYEILKHGDLGHLPLGVSIFSFRCGYDRAALAKYVGIEMTNYVHAFGLDNILEMLNLRDAGFNSVDSSIAATASVNDIQLWTDNRWEIDRRVDKSVKRVDLTCDKFKCNHHNRTFNNIRGLQSFANKGTIY